jgi:hypothetical protein
VTIRAAAPEDGERCELIFAAAYEHLALDRLRLAWGDASGIRLDSGRWQATRRDGRGEVTGDGPEDLRAAIIADYISDLAAG